MERFVLAKGIAFGSEAEGDGVDTDRLYRMCVECSDGDEDKYEALPLPFEDFSREVGYRPLIMVQKKATKAGRRKL